MCEAATARSRRVRPPLTHESWNGRVDGEAIHIVKVFFRKSRKVVLARRALTFYRSY